MVVNNLIEALFGSSEQVQSAIADCLVPLIKGMGPGALELIRRLMSDLFGGSTFCHRRGAAYGLAAAVKGRGIASLKESNAIAVLKEAAADKESTTRRQGALR